MLTVLSVILAGGAVVAFAKAVFSFFRVIMMVPRDGRLKMVLTTGWWQYDRITELCGPAAHPLVRRYIKAMMVFLLCVISLVVIGVVSGAGGLSASHAAAPDPGAPDARQTLAGSAGSTSISLPLRLES